MIEIPSGGLAQPSPNTTRDAPLVAVSLVGLLRSFPGMFVGHRLNRRIHVTSFNADKPAPLLRVRILPLHYHKLLSAPPPSRHTPLSRSLSRGHVFEVT